MKQRLSDKLDGISLNSGAYILSICISRKIKLSIGKLGTFELAAGKYSYTGSAMKNLRSRLERHLRKDKKLKWHIDYLLNSEFVEIVDIDIFESTEKMECIINKQYHERTNSTFPILKFGSSDCKFCPSHFQMIP